MIIDRPIFMVGTGRCGSTMLHRLLARHDHLAWLSPYNEVFPRQAWLSRLSQFYRNPSLSLKFRHFRYFPKPFECYRYWEHYLPGFSRRDKPQTADDVFEPGIEPVRESLARILRAQGKPRFLAKVTGWSRIGYFDRIFPDAAYIALFREHRSVVSSWVQAGWLDVTSGVDSPDWQWGPVAPAYVEAWRDLGATPVLSAALKIQLDLDDIRENLRLVPERSISVQYEDLLNDPHATLRAIVEFCELPWTPVFEREVERMVFTNPVDKWKAYLSEEEGEKVLEFFRRCEAAGQQQLAG